MKITNCKVNHLTNPVGYPFENLVFSWQVEGAKGKKQKQARIQIYEEELLCFDTDWKNLDSLGSRIDIVLKPYVRYEWVVTVESDSDEIAVSEKNYFETAKMNEPWIGKWIGTIREEDRHPIFSKKIKTNKSVKRARLYICGLGLYEARWNGQKIGDEYLTPYCNNYNEWLQYQTFDITDVLNDFEGILSVELGNGWYKGRFGFDSKNNLERGGYYGNSCKLIAEVHIYYEDNTKEIIGTDDSWTVTRSTIFFSNIYDGEKRDDTLSPIEEAACILDEQFATLVARTSTPVKVRKTVPVQQVIRTPNNELVLDFGQNLAGLFRYKVHIPKGHKLHFQAGEILQDGNFYRDNLRSAQAEYIYISDGNPHVLEPKFTYYGYRYIKVEGLDSIEPNDFVALVLYSELDQIGHLLTGNKKVNQLISNVEWGQRGNFIDVPTDCPQRDERMGWTGDAQIFAGTACYQMDSYAFFYKYLQDAKSLQKNLNGIVPMIIPNFGNNECAAAWSDMICIIPMKLYEMYGDKTILEEFFDCMCDWVNYITRYNQERGWENHFQFGDWLALDAPIESERRGGTDAGFVALVYYRHCVLLTACAAAILGDLDKKLHYEHVAQSILSKIREEYYTPSGRCAVSTQTGQLLSLYDSTSPNQNRAQADLVKALESTEGQLRTGFVGTPLLCPILTEIGHEDKAFNLLLNEGYPGWLYAVNLGATTIWERWNSLDVTGTIANNGMNSLNHYAYGSIVEWLYRDVAGISALEPGFRKAKLSPHMHTELHSCQCEYRSAAGVYKISWKELEDGTVEYRCSVPFGCTAMLDLPYGGPSYELEAGEFLYSYTPNKPLRTVFSVDSPLGKLLKNASVKNYLEESVPELLQLPRDFRDMTIREIHELNYLDYLTKQKLDELNQQLYSIT